MSRVHHGESPTDLPLGVIITSLGGDTLCPAVTLALAFLVRGVRLPKSASRTAVESSSLQFGRLFHRRSRGRGDHPEVEREAQRC
jgi:hypothetical protein